MYQYESMYMKLPCRQTYCRDHGSPCPLSSELSDAWHEVNQRHRSLRWKICSKEAHISIF